MGVLKGSELVYLSNRAIWFGGGHMGFRGIVYFAFGYGRETDKTNTCRIESPQLLPL